MPLAIIRDDITKLQVDAIVNAANSSLLGGGGVDGAIHRAAGPELLAECRMLGGCETGQAKLTKGYRLPAKHVIHTVGPVWRNGTQHEQKLLADCYRNALAIAQENHFDSIAFPMISSGAFGYPKDKALQVAIAQIGEFLLHHEMMVYLVVFDKTSFVLSKKLFASITQFIDDQYVEDCSEAFSNYMAAREREILSQMPIQRKAMRIHDEPVSKLDLNQNLHEMMQHKEVSFSQMLFRLIDEKEMTEVQAYKKANVDRKLFSKIRSDNSYQPSKTTAIAFAVALELNFDQTKDLLNTAGYSLSRSNKFDLIIEYFIKQGNYNVLEINEALFAFDQNLLGV